MVKPQLAADSRSEKEKSIFTHLTFAITTILIFNILLQVLNMNEMIRNDKQGKKKSMSFHTKVLITRDGYFFLISTLMQYRMTRRLDLVQNGRTSLKTMNGV